MRKIRVVLTLVLLIAVPKFCFGQYFQRLIDYDSTYDWGWDIFLKPSGDFIVFGGSLLPPFGLFANTMLEVSPSGYTTTHYPPLIEDSATVYDGNPGETRRENDSSFVGPISIQWSFSSGYFRSSSGLSRVDSVGSVIFFKKYTDTSINYEVINACNVANNHHYLIGGLRELNTSTSSWVGLLICTDSLGDTLWTHTYQKYPSEPVEILSIIPLQDGRIVLGAMSQRYIIIRGSAGYTYYHNSPWFLVVDSMGNVLKDTIYNNTFAGGGTIYADKNGGYMHFGNIDTMETGDPTDIENFPCYIAHLDTNFNVTWLNRLSYSDYYGYRACWQIKQLHDSAYLAIGDVAHNEIPYDAGWAAKFSKTGDMLWTHEYLSDSNEFAYIRDMVEKPDHNLVFCGRSYNDTLPTWHHRADIWLVATDSNGCEMAGCGPDTLVTITGVPDLQVPVLSLSVFPNPNSGSFTLSAPTAGDFMVYDLQGQLVGRFAVKKGDTEIALPRIAPGVYLGRLVGGDGVVGVVRVVRD